VLVRLDDQIDFEGCKWGYVVAEPRHQGRTIDGIQIGDKLICGFTGIREEEIQGNTSLDLRDWRGGLAFIGDFQPVS
jgi:hypothetical protein